jgi:hypothetical protein
MKRRISRIVLWAGLLAGNIALAQQAEMPSIPRTGLARNYDNITVDTTLKRVYYEQRLDRNPFIPMAELRSVVNDTTVQDYIPLFQGVMIARYRLGNTLETAAPYTLHERHAYHHQFPFERRKYKVDFWIQPVFAANFGNYNRPVESNTSVMIQSVFYVRHGMTLNYGILFPITNQLDGRPKMIRPAPIFLNQFFAFGHNFFSASAGFFHNDEYGLNLQYQHANLSSSWTYGLEASVTGMYIYYRDGVHYTTMNRVMALGNVAYRFANPDLTVKLSGGQFLYNDRGVRMDFVRQFTNVEVGLFATKSGNGSTIGFNFAIPIWPGKLLQGDRVRLRTTDVYNFEYNYTRGYQIGERYRVGYQLDQKLRQYHRNYLNRQYQQLR